MPVPSLHALAESMQEKGFTKEMALWMTTNLRYVPSIAHKLTLGRKTHEGFVWKFNLPGVRELLEDYFTTELWQYLSKPPPGMEVHFVRAEKSERWYVPRFYCTLQHFLGPKKFCRSFLWR